MAASRHTITISFRRDQDHIRALLLEHLQETGQNNRSAAIITLLEKALASPAPDGDSLTGLYELYRISHQAKEVHQQIEELSQLVTAQDQDTDAGGEPSDDTTCEMDDDDHQAAIDDEEAADQQNEPSTGQAATQDNLTPAEPEKPPRYARVWSATKNVWEWVIYEE